MMQTPPKPNSKPMIAFRGMLVLAAKSPITTSHKGKIAPMIEPNPAEMYFTPHVLSTLLNMKFRKLKTRIGSQSFLVGSGAPLIIKNRTYNNPATNCLMPANSRAGM